MANRNLPEGKQVYREYSFEESVYSIQDHLARHQYESEIIKVPGEYRDKYLVVLDGNIDINNIPPTRRGGR